jgi:glutamine phosphoribosylpyrophosphate amidotransferase
MVSASTYEQINVEDVRNRCGAFLARRDNVAVDLVAGIPDSGWPRDRLRERVQVPYGGRSRNTRHLAAQLHAADHACATWLPA